MPLLPPDKRTWLDQVLGLDPWDDPRVRSGMLYPEEVDLLAEKLVEEGIEPTPEHAARWLWRARRRLLRDLRDLGWTRQAIATSMAEYRLAKWDPAFQRDPEGPA